MNILISSFHSYPVSFTYTNYKGETKTRHARMIRVFWGSTEYHPEDQWLVEGHDLDKDAVRVYALHDISNVRSLSLKKPKV